MVGTVGAIVGIVGAGTQLAGGIMGGNASKAAGAQQAQAISQGIGFEQGVYNEAKSNFAPYIQQGQNALQSIAQFYGLAPGGGAAKAYQNYQNTPFYQFPLQQSLDTLNRQAARRGLNLSGGQLNALQSYAQDYASKNFQTYLQGLSGLAGGGMTASQNIASAGTNLGQDMMRGYTGMGISNAAGTMGKANQTNDALGGVAPLIQGAGNLYDSLTKSSYDPTPSGNGTTVPTYQGSLAGYDMTAGQTAPGFTWGGQGGYSSSQYGE